MAKKPTVTTLQSGFNSTEVLNENFENIRDAFDNTLSLDGSTPNAMQADLDLNGNNLIGATGLLINGTDYLADVEAAKAAALVAQAAAELAENNAETAEVNAEASETAAGLSATAAATSATNAGASETAASASATASATSATNSATSASQAATSASAAAVSEGNAATSETNAANSATSASGSASTATTQASAASVSATNAATSASNAATSATNAAASQAAAATSETNAAASESTVTTSATNAATSEANAATSASTATTQATNAATSASTASTSATNAATSETNAASSASSAASSATSAQASKDAALAALDSFDDRYLGQKVSDPTLDNDGNALVAGALYFNTTDGIMKVYDGSVWLAAYASLSGALIATNNLSDVLDVTASRTNLGLGTAATTASTDYATAAQGALAVSAVQPNDSPSFGSVTVTGTVDGRNVAADGSKLDGIEAGATADQTASEILTSIKTVDGSGSGLDADLLDGIHASSFLQGNQTITLSGDVSGSGTTSILVTVADDSHNHIIANVDGLQTALDGKWSKGADIGGGC
ncbi:gp7 [Roseobacter phage SIO1]|uniref:Gp7 n=1 Tax=Roseobacter phage SIO1 TaxID=2905867 RepID=Q9G0H8_9CAUD|nr:tail fiber protein [Roseobacter phage SIO1]AAG02590.1 gp7 [Roseobacter phage SIO1]